MRVPLLYLMCLGLLPREVLKVKLPYPGADLLSLALFGFGRYSSSFPKTMADGISLEPLLNGNSYSRKDPCIALSTLRQPRSGNCFYNAERNWKIIHFIGEDAHTETLWPGFRTWVKPIIYLAKRKAMDACLNEKKRTHGLVWEVHAYPIWPKLTAPGTKAAWKQKLGTT